jgi:subtilase family serine protease
MNKTFFKIGLGLLAMAGLVWPSRGAVIGMKTLHGHVPAAVAHLTKTGDVASTNKLHLAIGVELRNQAALDDLVNQVSDPSSPNYQHYLSRDEFVGHFAPTEADYQSVIDFAKSQGLTVVKTSPNRMLVEVEGQASAVQRAFNVSLHNYKHPSENRIFFAPDSEPTVPSTLPIADIGGLNNYSRPHSHLHPAKPLPNSSTAGAGHATNGPKLGSGPFGLYMGNDFRTAYAPGAPQTGTGQNVALVQFDGYFPSDIQQYESMNGLPNVTLTNILLNGFSGAPTLKGGEIEVSLDIEMVISMAPGVNQVMLYEGNPDNFFPNVVLNQIAVDNAARQVSCSWGWGGGPNSTSDQIFKEMILQGQTFYDASGDQDAFLPGEVDNPGLPGFPSDDPYITQVGATTLSTAGPSGAFISETVWNYTSLGEDGIGSSGGVSSFYGIPSWQTNAPIIAAGGSTTFRNFPDVACVGDNVLVIADGGTLFGEAGTSCAAPLWGGFTALVNQQAAAVGHAPVGFINPTLYALGVSQFYTNVFNDVTTGSNAWSSSPNLFFAKTNYDLCTGLGSMRGTNLISALTSITNISVSIVGLIPAPTQPWGNTLSVMNGANPNGLWFLYYQDDTRNNLSSTNYNGWSLNLTTANPVGQAGDDQLYVNTTINSTAYGNATNVPAVLGASWHTVLAVTNYGPSLSSNVVVTETLPDMPGVTFVSSNTALGTITNFGGIMIWNVGNLAVNAGGTLTLNLQVNSTGLYTNSAVVNALTVDPNPDDDSIMVIASSAVTTPPLLSPPFATGGHGFQLTVTNNPGATIVIQASTNLLTWLPIVTNVSPFTYTNSDSTNYSRRFYRAMVQQ